MSNTQFGDTTSDTRYANTYIHDRTIRTRIPTVNYYSCVYSDRKRIGENLRLARGRRSQKELSRIAAVTQATVSRIEQAVHEPAASILGRLARATEVSTDYLLGLTDDPTPSDRLAAKVSELEDVNAVTTDEADGHSVDVMELDTAAGAGAVVDFERVKDRIRFRRSWLRKHGIVARQCKVIGVKGTSMEPTLTDGCSILIDLNRRSRLVGHIYVARTDDGLIVKRAGKNRAGNWQLVSDNPDKKEWPTLRWPADADVIGEVKWAARTF